jgi:hypothetical protein
MTDTKKLQTKTPAEYRFHAFYLFEGLLLLVFGLIASTIQGIIVI